ncbi:MAG: hypothetical protein ACFBSE_02315 [Prochloraceae cyanobacterium]
MALNSGPKGKSNKIYVIAAYKENRQVGYLFWHSKADSPKTLRVAGRASSNIATWSSYQKAELALNDRVAGRLITAKDNLESEGYELKIVEFG